MIYLPIPGIIYKKKAGLFHFSVQIIYLSILPYHFCDSHQASQSVLLFNVISNTALSVRDPAPSLQLQIKSERPVLYPDLNYQISVLYTSLFTSIKTITHVGRTVFAYIFCYLLFAQQRKAFL